MTGKRTMLAAVAVSAVTFVLFGGIARAAAPTATTGPATAIGATTATVTGSVVPGGQATTWYIQYGTTTAYGSQTAKASAGSGTRGRRTSRPISRASRPASTYHYRVVASNSAGTVHGGDAVFTTLAPPGATTGAATGIGSTTATLNGDRRSEQPRHHLLLRVRHLDELRDEDHGQERGLGREPAERGGRHLEALGRPDLSLPDRRDERRRDDARAPMQRSRPARRRSP